VRSFHFFPFHSLRSLSLSRPWSSLQCPQTHLGLVVAFSSTTLAPLIDFNVKFKWYRMGDNMEQFMQIDEGPRGWYPPTADDIGKKICANCEDTLDQGFCRYAEVILNLSHLTVITCTGWSN
jgi:hypothetical protein